MIERSTHLRNYFRVLSGYVGLSGGRSVVTGGAKVVLLSGGGCKKVVACSASFF